MNVAITIAVVVTAFVTSLIYRWAYRRDVSRRSALLTAEEEKHHRELLDQLREPVDWVIVGTRDPGVGVVLMVGQEPVKFDMFRRLTGGFKRGPLGARLPDYRLVFSGETENFEQIRAATYEEALAGLMERRVSRVLRRPHVL